MRRTLGWPIIRFTGVHPSSRQDTRGTKGEIQDRKKAGSVVFRSADPLNGSTPVLRESPNGSNDFLAAGWKQRLPRRRMGATSSSPLNWEQRLPCRRMGATTSSLAGWERRLSCRRLGGQGGRSPHFTLSPLYTSRPPNRLTTQKSRRQEYRPPDGNECGVSRSAIAPEDGAIG